MGYGGKEAVDRRESIDVDRRYLAVISMRRRNFTQAKPRRLLNKDKPTVTLEYRRETARYTHRIGAVAESRKEAGACASSKQCWLSCALHQHRTNPNAVSYVS